jgi:hypothetical protein
MPTSSAPAGFKIQRADGTYYVAGMKNWKHSTVGKLWAKQAHLLAAIKMQVSEVTTRHGFRWLTPAEYLAQFPEGDVVIEYALVEVKRTPIREFMASRLPDRVKEL